MRRQVTRALAWYLVAVTAAVTAVGCSQTVDGSAQRARPGVPDPDRSYGYVDDRCGLLLDDTIKELLSTDSIVRPYSGAVCQYVLSGRSGLVDAVFSWFDAGSFERERALAGERGIRITDKDIQRHSAFLGQRPDNAAACSATAAAGSGVLAWWVQFRPMNGQNPCEAAEKLLSATLSADM
ncbi:MAG: hypothetical protein QOE04_4785 [Mycobacterium sp.]|jgi:hypothetical protein|nr:hypothetical protein [Mycobacterium sp.]